MVKIEDIFEAYYDCRKRKRKTYNAIQFELDYERNLVELCEQINNRTYAIGKSVAFVVTRPKYREVFAADFRDRIVHHLVIRKLEPLFEESFIEDNYNCRVGKGTLYGVKRLSQQIHGITEGYTKDAFIYKADIKGFFMHIDRNILWSKLERFIAEMYNEADKDEILWIAKMIVMHEPENNCIRKGCVELWDILPKDKSLFTCGKGLGLPIGNISSQVFANFYLSEFDNWAKRTFKGYGRYVDDFFIIDDKKKMLRTLAEIRERLSLLGLQLHPRKFYLQHFSKGVTFTGSAIKYNRLYIGKRTVYNFREAIEKYNAVEDKKVVTDKFLATCNSYLGFMKQYLSYGIKREVEKLINKEWYKYVYISGPMDKFVKRVWLKNENARRLKDLYQTMYV